MHTFIGHHSLGKEKGGKMGAYSISMLYMIEGAWIMGCEWFEEKFDAVRDFFPPGH